MTRAALIAGIREDRIAVGNWGHPPKLHLLALTMLNSPPRVIQLTPPGRGGVATLRIEGRGALEAVERHFRDRNGWPLPAHPADHLVVGRFGGEVGEEVVARRCCEDAVELHCHGGRAAVARIEESLLSAGCRRMTWREWTRSRTDDPIAAAALVALADARTERTAAILLDQYHGALRRAINEIGLAIDRGEASAASSHIDSLLAHEALGRRLTRPWRVVVAGGPNVGKSSLVNALAGYGRAIVDPMPGTTRDAVAAATAIDGWPVELCDTAGLREADDAIERAGVELAREHLAQADLVVIVADQSVPWSTDDQALADHWPTALWVHNKCDLPASPEHRPAGLSTSALLGHGIDALLQAIAHQLVPDLPPAGAAVPFLSEHIEMLHRLRMPV
jgi:tRNA modification GTPase